MAGNASTCVYGMKELYPCIFIGAQRTNATGPVPPELAGLEALQIFDLLKNKLAGEVYKELTNTS